MLTPYMTVREAGYGEAGEQQITVWLVSWSRGIVIQKQAHESLEEAAQHVEGLKASGAQDVRMRSRIVRVWVSAWTDYLV